MEAAARFRAAWQGFGRAIRLAVCITAAMSAPALGQGAGDLPVDLELVLLVDVSGSVDAQEAELQRKGYANALSSPQVVEAIQSGPMGRIAVTYVEWADDGYQNQVVGWSVVQDANSARAFAGRLAEAPIGTAFWTSIGAAIDFATALFPGNGFEGSRQVIDISGDGYSNRGRPPAEARDAAVAAGITINALPILNSRPNPWGGLPPLDLDRYFQDQVIGGPGAFILVAEDFSTFGQAILSKLVREIAALPAPTDMRNQAAALP